MTKKHRFFMGGLMFIVALALVGCGQSWSDKELATETSGVNLSREVSRGGYKLVTTPELKGWIDQKKPMMIIDTMPLEDSYKKQHVPGAVQIDSTGGGKADTLQVRARILEAFREGTKRLVAHDSVAMVRSDLAARGQEACLYTEGDSLQLRTKPYLWYEESQVSGDSMNVYMKHRKLERLLVMGNTLTMSESDSLHPGRFDQMMGDRLTMQFDTSGLHRTDV